jgi:hypothetical protein
LGEIIGLYTGIVDVRMPNTDYMWNYPHEGPKGVRSSEKRDKWGIDGRLFGNYMRFINHDDDKLNCQPTKFYYKVKISV